MTQLLVVMEEWSQLLDQGHPVDAIYLDFRKAFDTVPHQRLLKKLEAYGVRGKLFNWIEAFLVSRKQSVVINGTKSSWTEVKSGIPQGSVLGPLLFVVFINDMSAGVASTCKLFADGSKLYEPVSTDEGIQAIQKDLTQLVGWSEKWQMGHNVDKCKTLHLGNHNPGHQ